LSINNAQGQGKIEGTTGKENLEKIEEEIEWRIVGGTAEKKGT
jgi:hypothetical protein